MRIVKYPALLVALRDVCARAVRVCSGMLSVVGGLAEYRQAVLNSLFLTSWLARLKAIIWLAEIACP